jgi:hypothetical protein
VTPDDAGSCHQVITTMSSSRSLPNFLSPGPITVPSGRTSTARSKLPSRMSSPSGLILPTTTGDLDLLLLAARASAPASPVRTAFDLGPAQRSSFNESARSMSHFSTGPFVVSHFLSCLSGLSDGDALRPALRVVAVFGLGTSIVGTPGRTHPRFGIRWVASITASLSRSHQVGRPGVASTTGAWGIGSSSRRWWRSCSSGVSGRPLTSVTTLGISGSAAMTELLLRCEWASLEFGCIGAARLWCCCHWQNLLQHTFLPLPPIARNDRFHRFGGRRHIPIAGLGLYHCWLEEHSLVLSPPAGQARRRCSAEYHRRMVRGRRALPEHTDWLIGRCRRRRHGPGPVP